MYRTVDEWVADSIERTHHDYDRDTTMLEKIVDSVKTLGSDKVKVHLDTSLYARYHRENGACETKELCERPTVDIVAGAHLCTHSPVTVVLANGYWCGYSTDTLAPEVMVEKKRKETTRQLPAYAKAV